MSASTLAAGQPLADNIATENALRGSYSGSLFTAGASPLFAPTGSWSEIATTLL